MLIFDTELQDLESMVKQVARCGVDAVIVQDTGAVQLIRGDPTAQPPAPGSRLMLARVLCKAL